MVKKLRSLILEYFPEELRFQIELLSKRRGISNKEKQDELFKLLRQFEIENISPLGSGTNRYAFKMNGFAIKVATDHDGKIDNMKEFKMAKRLFPYVTKTYEISSNGTLLVAEYIQPFSSYGEMLGYADKIRSILTKLSNVYLIGDVGITSKNYANWGLRVGSEEPVCLDFAYVYDVKSELFVCSACKNNSMLVPNKDFTELICPSPNCGHKYKFEDIRRKLGNDIHNHEIGNLDDEGYLLFESNVETTLDPNRSNYLNKEEKPKKPKKEKDEEKEEVFDAFVLDKSIEDYLKEDKNMKQNSSIISTGALNFKTPIRVKAKTVSVKNADEPADAVAFSADIITAEASVIDESNDDDDDLLVEPLEESVSTVVDEISNNAGVIISDDDEAVTESIIEVDPQDAEEKPEEMKLQDKFIKNINKAISKLSNTIKTEIYHRNLYDEFSGSLLEKLFPENFYSICQNCVFRSLTNYLNLTQIEAPNMNRPGTHKEWVLQDLSIMDECYGTLTFLQNYFLDMNINRIEEPEEMLKAYKEKYGEELIQIDWISFLANRLKLKLKMTNESHQRLAEAIAETWVNRYSNEDENEITSIPKEFLDMKMTSNVNIADSVIPDAVDTTEEVFSSEILHVNDIDDNDEEDEEDTESLRVEIYPSDDSNGIDNIRVLTGDYIGYVEIPFYTDLSKVSSEDLTKKSSDEIVKINGVWNWISYLTPDKMFTTDNYRFWMDNINVYDTIEEDMVLCICLDHRADGKYVMGIYEFSGVYHIGSSEGVSFVSDINIYNKLNNFLSGILSYIGLSQNRYMVNDDDNMVDENQLSKIFNFELPTNNDDATRENNELEDAAIAALVDNAAEEIQNETADQSSDELVHVDDYDEYEEVETFQPIRKKNKK